ncbi:hypothetical protein Q7P37_006423 [Cladosporium fusiforme]
MAIVASHSQPSAALSPTPASSNKLNKLAHPQPQLTLHHPRIASHDFNDRNEPHERLTTPLIRKRNEQASAYYRQQLSDFSRPSSSSGSVNTLRRTPKFDDPRKQSHVRASSVDSPPRIPFAQREGNNRTVSPHQRYPSPHRRRAASAHPVDHVPHPALRISNRTHAAVLYALEEALRKPHPFSADLDEESAQMSDLGGGRASNGGARTGGPVPVPSGTPTGLKTPRDVMRNRQEREARRQEEAKMEEQRRAQLAQERRYSAERRAGGPGYSTGQPQYPSDATAHPGNVPGNRNSGSGFVASGADYGVPTGRTIAGDSGYVSGGPAGGGQNRRAASSSVAQDQPRPAQSTAGPTRRPVSQSAPGSRQPSGSQPQQATAGASSSTAPPVQPPPPLNVGEGQQGSKSSSFPHAFERWEQLSSHWEGLTSYWLRKLESDAEDIQRSVPSASAMSRQITDLSAAGANLFHAVVELQRLRASSERKFQRWFFETRADTERNQELKAQLEQQLHEEQAERQRSAKQRVESDIAAENARREVAEMRRELMISKEEARRAWEELGRRNQDSLDLAESLKAGRVTVVSGVQVVPYFGGPSRTGSANQQRPSTREGMPYGGTAASGVAAAGMQSPGAEMYYREQHSPTNTDPFTESKPMHHEPDVSSLAAGTYQPYPLSSPHDGTTSAQSGASAQTAIPMAGQRPGSAGQLGGPRHHMPIVSSDGQFYQHQPQDTYLHSPQPPSSGPGGPQDFPHELTYVTSEGGTEYPIEQPSGYRRATQHSPISEEDDYDTAADVRREAELAARYRSSGAVSGQILPEAPTIPATSAQAMASYEPSPPPQQQHQPQQQPAGPDYEGEGYGDWDTLRTAHHHPTRLSDASSDTLRDLRIRRGTSPIEDDDVHEGIATRLTVQRLRPVMVGLGDVHSGGLDGSHAPAQNGAPDYLRERFLNRRRQRNRGASGNEHRQVDTGSPSPIIRRGGLLWLNENGHGNGHGGDDEHNDDYDDYYDGNYYDNPEIL